MPLAPEHLVSVDDPSELSTAALERLVDFASQQVVTKFSLIVEPGESSLDAVMWATSDSASQLLQQAQAARELIAAAAHIVQSQCIDAPAAESPALTGDELAPIFSTTEVPAEHEQDYWRAVLSSDPSL